MALTKPDESILDLTSTGNAINQVQSNLDTAEADLYTEVENKILGAHITGLEISNGTDSDHDIDIATGFCKDDTYTYLLELTSGLTKRLDEPWAEGTNTGGLDTITGVTADTWYYIWLIRKDSDGSIDALFSTSATNPTLPAGYTYKRRIRGAILTDGSANILGFIQKDDLFKYKQPITDVTDGSTGTSTKTVTISVQQNFLGIFKANVPAVLKEKGCTQYFPAIDLPADLPPQQLDNNVVTVIETWESVEDLKAHLSAPHMLEYRENTKDLVEGVSVKVLKAV